MRKWLLATVVLAASLGALPAIASTFHRVTLPELIQHSPGGVIQGRVLSTSAAWNDEQSLIFTTATIQVTRSLAGAWQPGETVIVREAGGTVDGYTVNAIAFPRFDVGDDLVMFLGPTWEDGDLRVAGYGMGFY